MAGSHMSLAESTLLLLLICLPSSALQREHGRQHETAGFPFSTEPVALSSLQRSEAEGGSDRNPTHIPLQSAGRMLREHHRRLQKENRSRELFLLEEELIDWESLRHLSRYEQHYRQQYGVDLEYGWNGEYSDQVDSSRRNQTTATKTTPERRATRRIQATSSGRKNSFTNLKTGKFDNYQSIPLNQGYGTHIAVVWVGSPKPQRKTVIIDTGSHYTAFPCKGCRNCGRSHHTDPYFNPATSDTFHQLQCDECAGGVVCEKGRCLFSQAYTEGSSWDAVQVKDRFYCGGSDVLDSVDPHHQKYSLDFMFGCMQKMSGLFLTQLADGIMGMSAHQATLPKQLWDKGLIEHNMFAMCFRRELGTSKRGVSAGSMTLGGVSTSLDTGPVVYAKNMARAGWFTVFVKNIYIRAGGGQSAKDSNPPRKYVKVRINPRTVNSGKGVIVDSGTTDTYLSKSAAPAFKKAWKEATGKAYSHSSVRLTDEELRKLPTVLVQCHAYGGQKDPSIDDYDAIPGYTGKLDPSAPEDLLIAIPATSYMDYSPSTKMYTSRLYFTETAGGVLGSNTMQGHNVVFDWEHSRIGFAESSCSYDKSDLPQLMTEDEGYASDCQVKEPVLSRPCLDSVDRPLCRFNQSNIALLGTEKWSAVVKNPGTRLGVTCIEAAQQMEVKDHYRDPSVSCDSKGICEEERPCQLTCKQVQKASLVVKQPEESQRLKCGDSHWSACDRGCFQTRILSAAFSDGKCHEVSRERRRCHIDACAREDPCRAPYSVRVVLGLRDVDIGRWSRNSESTLTTSVANVLDSFGMRMQPGDVAVRLARSWYMDEDSPDAAADTGKDTENATPNGVKAIVDVVVANNRTGGNISGLEDDSDFEDHWKILGNLSKHLVGQLRETRCYDDDLFALAQKSLAIKTFVMKEARFMESLVASLRKNVGNRSPANVFSSAVSLNKSAVISAWPFRNGVDENVNYLGPRKPWWFGIFRAVHFTTVLVTTSLVLWSIFGIVQNVYENGLDVSWLDFRRYRRWWRLGSSSTRDSSTSLDEGIGHPSNKDADEGVALVVKSRDSHRHGNTSPRKRNGASNRISESQSFSS